MTNTYFYACRTFSLEANTPLLGLKKIARRLRKNVHIQINLVQSKPKDARFKKAFQIRNVGTCYRLHHNFLIVLKSPPTNWLDIANLLTHEFLPFILCLYGFLCLHGTIIRESNKSTLVLGKSGTGKSTLAFYNRTVGLSVPTDENILVLKKKGRMVARPLIQTIRVHRAIKPSGTLGSSHGKWVISDYQKQDDRSSPFTNIYILNSTRPTSPSLNISKVVGAAALKEILVHTFWPKDLPEVHRKLFFAQIVELLGSSSVYLVQYPHRRSTLRALSNQLVTLLR